MLIEIPIAMSLAGAQKVVAAGEASGVVYGLCHPMRFRREREALRQRVRAATRRSATSPGFFIKRLINIGATGYKRSWHDNILWHHFCHFVDLGMFLFGDTPIRRVQSHSASSSDDRDPDGVHGAGRNRARPDAAGARLLPRDAGGSTTSSS